MSSQAISSALRGGASVAIRRSAQLTRGGGGHHRPPPPPFARVAAPSQPLHEDAELVWNDGVAPETLIDFDAPHVPKYRALKHLGVALGGLLTLMGVVTVYNPDSWRQAVRCVPQVPRREGGKLTPRPSSGGALYAFFV